MTDTEIHSEGGAVVSGDVRASTVIGRDQIIVIGGYTGADLDAALDRLQEILGSGCGRLCADGSQRRLTVRDASGEPLAVLSAEAAEIGRASCRERV